MSDKTYPMRVKEFSSRADPDTLTFQVTLIMPQPEEFNLMPGMTAQVEVALEMRKSPEEKETAHVAIPAIAVLGDEQGDPYVWIVDEKNMTVHRRDLKVGEMTGTEKIQILEGLQTRRHEHLTCVVEVSITHL